MSTDQVVPQTAQTIEPQTAAPTAAPTAVRAAPAGENQDTFFVRTLAGKTLVFSWSPDTTIITIKQKIQENENINTEQQRLVFQGKQLDDDKKLSDYGIQASATLHLILRLRGGIEIKSPIKPSL